MSAAPAPQFGPTPQEDIIWRRSTIEDDETIPPLDELIFERDPPLIDQ
jgi:hypothetical protein